MSDRIPGPASPTIVEVVIPGVKGTNISSPDARAGFAALFDAQRMLSEGLPIKVVYNTLRIKYGAEELVQAICAAIGQEELRRAVKQGRAYSMTIEEGSFDPDWEDKPK